LCSLALGFVGSSATGEDLVSMRLMGDLIVDGGLEIVVFDSAHDRLHAIGSAGRYVIDFRTDGPPVVASRHRFVQDQRWDATSIVVDPAGRGFAAVSWVPERSDAAPGRAQIIDLETGDPVGDFAIGYQPDCLVFSPDGSMLYAANEGEPFDTNRLGAITIADLGSIESPDDFFGFDAIQTYTFEERFLAEGLDLSPLRVRPEFSDEPSIDIEPEYIAPAEGGAWVALQENNALAYFDLGSRSWTRLIPLGVLAFPFDVSETDGPRLHSGRGFGLLPLPDSIALFESEDQRFIVTANEGEKLERRELRLSEAIEQGRIDPERVAQLRAAFGDLEARGIDQLYISTIDGDLDGDGDIDQLCVQGGRSVSIYNELTGMLVWNSGSQIELVTGMLFPDRYNQGDSRSDRAGPEPEGIAIQEHQGRTLMAIGLERTSAVMLYDITEPEAPELLDAVALSTGCAGPEGLAFFTRNDRLHLAVASEVGGCLSVYVIE
jgi:2',3'-cyclic-nucleotide 2'-phosphodiesterase/3'-nucleotidase/5'-nucleotidase